MVASIRKQVAAKGRDPESFDFCIWVFTLIHDDPSVISRALDNPLFRWLAAIYGRMNMADWRVDGEEPVFPLDWHYSMKLVPHYYTDRAEVDRLLAGVTRRMSELCFIWGNAEQVAAQIQPYIDAGATCVDIAELLPLLLDPADAQAAIGRQLDVCARVKKNNPG